MFNPERPSEPRACPYCHREGWCDCDEAQWWASADDPQPEPDWGWAERMIPTEDRQSPPQ